MSYGTKYYSYINDTVGNVFTVNLNFLDYTGSSTQITAYDLQPAIPKYYGGNDVVDNAIHGSAFDFSFWVYSGQTYDDIFESNPKDIQLEVYEGTGITAQLYWKGWVQLDSLSRSFVEPQYFLTVNATDGLGDLKEIEFPFSFYMTTGQTSILRLIKFCLEENGIDLDFAIQCNLFENHVSTGSTMGNMLKKIYANPNRFYRVSNGRITFTNSYNAIEWLLEPFRAKLIQSDGCWTITQKNEIESPLIIHDWDTLSGLTSTTRNRLIVFSAVTTSDSPAYKPLVGGDNLTKLPPSKSIETTVRSVTTGTYAPAVNGLFNFNIIPWESSANPHDFNTVEWDSGNTQNNFSGRLKARYLVTTPIYNDEAYVYSGAIQLNDTVGSTITVSAQVLLDYVVYSGSPVNPRQPSFKIELVKDDGEFDEHDMVVVDSVEKELPLGEIKLFYVSLRFTESGAHRLRFYWVPHTFVNDSTIYFDGITVFRNNDDSNDRDKLHTVENLSSRSPFITEKTIYFSDSNQNNEGSLFYKPSGLTSTWSNFGNPFNIYPFSGWTNEAGISADWSYVSNAHQVTLSGIAGSDFLKTSISNVPAGYFKVNVSFNRVGSGTVQGILRYYHNSTLIGQSANFNIDSGTTQFDVTTLITGQTNQIKLNVFRTTPTSSATVRFNSIVGYGGNNEQLPLVQLYNYNVMRLNQKFNDYVRLSIIDHNNIKPWNILKIRNKNYQITGYGYDIKNNVLDLELYEHSNDDISGLYYDEQTLDTADGNPLNED
jgi:hypothetical protein